MSDKLSVERTSRLVIERKLLAALEEEGTVAILASKEDLKTMIAALSGYEYGEWCGNTLSWEKHLQRCMGMAADYAELFRQAFPEDKL